MTKLLNTDTLWFVHWAIIGWTFNISSLIRNSTLQWLGDDLRSNRGWAIGIHKHADTGSKDPHRQEQKCFFLSPSSSWVWKSFHNKFPLLRLPLEAGVELRLRLTNRKLSIIKTRILMILKILVNTLNYVFTLCWLAYKGWPKKNV